VRDARQRAIRKKVSFARAPIGVLKMRDWKYSVSLPNDSFSGDCICVAREFIIRFFWKRCGRHGLVCFTVARERISWNQKIRLRFPVMSVRKWVNIRCLSADLKIQRITQPEQAFICEIINKWNIWDTRLSYRFANDFEIMNYSDISVSDNDWKKTNAPFGRRNYFV